MKSWIKIMSVGAGLLAISTSFAQAPADAPAGSTGLCKDGSYWTGPTKSGACSGHKGVKAWYAAQAASLAAATTAAPTAPAAMPPAAPPAAKPVSPSAAPVSMAQAAPGGGPGMVWVNKSSKVYHCSTDKWYGKTKNGEYMTEANAKAAGNHADHNKACGS